MEREISRFPLYCRNLAKFCDTIQMLFWRNSSINPPRPYKWMLLAICVVSALRHSQAIWEVHYREGNFQLPTEILLNSSMPSRCYFEEINQSITLDCYQRSASLVLFSIPKQSEECIMERELSCFPLYCRNFAKIFDAIQVLFCRNKCSITMFGCKFCKSLFWWMNKSPPPNVTNMMPLSSVSLISPC